MKLFQSFLFRISILLIIIIYCFGFIFIGYLISQDGSFSNTKMSLLLNDLSFHPIIKSSPTQKSFTIIETPTPKIIEKKIPSNQINSNNLQFPILMMHHIRNYYNTEDPIGMGLSITPNYFEEILIKIQSQKYSVITFHDLIEYYFFNTPLPKKPIMLTFDDGYDDIYTEALPLLQKYNMKGSFSIITGLTGKAGYLTWDQIKQMKNLGEEITSHTVTHPSLATIGDIDLKKELFESKSNIDKELNQNTQILIYPSGRYNQKVIDEAKSAGYIMARTTESTYKIDGTKLFQIPTIRVTSSGMGF